MNFQVPQFIETEDKIIGPLTLKQFAYLAIGGGISFALFFALKPFLWIFITSILAVVSISFAFIKVNGRPLSVSVLAALNFYWKPRFYLWQRLTETPKMPSLAKQPIPEKSLLENLLQQIKTTKNPIPKREKAVAPSILDRVKSSKERFEMMRKITGEKEIARRVDYR